MKSLKLLCAWRQLQYAFSFFFHLYSDLSQLRASLDEYTQTGTWQDRQFEYGTYSKVFAGFLDMQRQINQNPKHAAKTRELQVAWACTGGYEMYIKIIYWRVLIPMSERKPDRSPWFHSVTSSALFWIDFVYRALRVYPVQPLLWFHRQYRAMFMFVCMCV